MLVQEMSSLFR